MLHIFCPHCGEYREEDEFHYKGEAHLLRPDPDSASDEEWGDFLFFRKNPRGVHHEMWYHTSCRKLFNVTRDTVSYEVLEVYRIGDQPAITGQDQARGVPA